MRRGKRRLFTILLSGVLAIGGCAAEKAADIIQEASEQLVATPTPVPTPTPEPTPMVTQLKLGDKAKVGDWAFTVKKVSTKTQIKTSKYMGYEAKKGNKYICISISVKNNGAEEAKFLPSIGIGNANTMMSAVIHYQDKYEYKPYELISYDKDIVNETIRPLDKKSGLLVFEVPKEVASHLGKCTLQIGTVNENVIYPLKKK